MLFRSLAAVEEGYEAVGIKVTDAYFKLGTDRVRIALEAGGKAEESETEERKNEDQEE